ncbi:MAG: hypothetical protein AB7Q42_05650 [Acidimicrobiia bacterium]
MSRRSFLVALVAAPAIAGLLGACGDDSPPDAGGSGTDPTAPTTTSPAGGYEHGTGAEDVVIRIDAGVGAFTTQTYAFQRIPALLVTGDGRAFHPGAQIAIYPPPLLPAVEVLTVDEASIQALLAAADDAGLLAAPPDYTEGAPQVTDVGSTVVTLAAGGATYVHEAYALGFDQETSPARQALQSFVEAAQSISGGLTGGVPFAPGEFEVLAVVDDVANYTEEPRPVVQPWPTETGVRLADASTCLPVPAAQVQSVFDAANELSFFEEDGVTYRLAVRPVLPGAERCAS